MSDAVPLFHWTASYVIKNSSCSGIYCCFAPKAGVLMGAISWSAKLMPSMFDRAGDNLRSADERDRHQKAGGKRPHRVCDDRRFLSARLGPRLSLRLMPRQCTACSSYAFSGHHVTTSRIELHRSAQFKPCMPPRCRHKKPCLIWYNDQGGADQQETCTSI